MKANREVLLRAAEAGPKARKCRGCGKDFPITCVAGDLAGYWHLSCLLKARKKLLERLRDGEGGEE